MPKTEIEYANTVIYKIMCKDETIKDVYVGHTTNFVKRKYQHKTCALHKRKGLVYDFINEHGGWNNWSMIEIEMYPCSCIREAMIRERYYIDNENSTLNLNKPFDYDNVEPAKPKTKILKEKTERQLKALANLEKGKLLRAQKQKEYYHNNLDQERERSRQKQFNHYHNVKKPKNDIIKAYLIIEDLKNSNPEYLEEIKMVLSN